MLDDARRTSRGLQALPCVFLVAVLTSGCSDADRLGFDFDFAQGTHGWVAGFADYPPADEAIYGLESDYRPLPEPLDTAKDALYISGINRSDDLFMYYKGQAGLRPSTSYRVRFDVEIATNAQTGCFGVGGSPGESVYVKAGVSLVEPEGILDGAGYLRMNVDKGQQSNGGENALVLGDMANSQSCGSEAPRWELKRLSGAALQITTDETGRVWLFVGTDSGFESVTQVYYTRFSARFDPT